VHTSELPAGSGALVSWPDPVAGSTAAGAPPLAGGGAPAPLGGVPHARASGCPPKGLWTESDGYPRAIRQPPGHRGRGPPRRPPRPAHRPRPGYSAGTWSLAVVGHQVIGLDVRKTSPQIWRRPAPAVGAVQLGGDGVGERGEPVHAGDTGCALVAAAGKSGSRNGQRVGPLGGMVALAAPLGRAPRGAEPGDRGDRLVVHSAPTARAGTGM
jgi:hypothetical protein